MSATSGKIATRLLRDLAEPALRGEYLRLVLHDARGAVEALRQDLELLPLLHLRLGPRDDGESQRNQQQREAEQPADA